MADRLYAEHKNGKKYIIFFNVENDSLKANMTVEEYINEIKRLNPQLTKVYTL